MSRTTALAVAAASCAALLAGPLAASATAKPDLPEQCVLVPDGDGHVKQVCIDVDG